MLCAVVCSAGWERKKAKDGKVFDINKEDKVTSPNWPSAGKAAAPKSGKKGELRASF